MSTKSAVATNAANTAQSLTAADQAAQASEAAGANTSAANAQSIVAGEQPALSNITGVQANGQTPLQQALTQQLTQQTSSSYDQAEANARQNALASGLQASGAGVGNENAVRAQEASALGQIPAQVESQVVPQEIAAANAQTAGAGAVNQAGGLQASLAQTLSPNQPLTTEAGIGQEENQANSALWSGLANAGLGVLPSIKW